MAELRALWLVFWFESPIGANGLRLKTIFRRHRLVKKKDDKV